MTSKRGNKRARFADHLDFDYIGYAAARSSLSAPRIARRYRPPVHMIRLTSQREITPYKWVHPDDQR
jgi:hypothetical protein